MTQTSAAGHENVRRGIGFILLGMTAISVNDMLIKQLSGGYPLHQMVFIRSAIGICISLILVQFEGGFRILKTDRPWLHLLRGLLVVFSNLAFFAALSVLPLAETTTLFFVAPLFITLLSIPLLGEKVGIRRIGAVLVGFLGVIVMFRPAENAGGLSGGMVLLLPVFAALTYAGMQILTRKLGVKSQASAMAVYIQFTFLIVSSGFWLVAGDGRYADDLDTEILVFLLRAWNWPSATDWVWFILLGAVSGVVGYSLSQAYRSAAAATIAPFEYIALPLAIFWGWVIFGDLPDTRGLIGAALIAGSGIYVFLRERLRARPLASSRPLRRW